MYRILPKEKQIKDKSLKNSFYIHTQGKPHQASSSVRYFSPGIVLEACKIQEVSLTMVPKNEPSSELELKLGEESIFKIRSNEALKSVTLNKTIVGKTKVVFELTGTGLPTESCLTVKMNNDF